MAGDPYPKLQAKKRTIGRESALAIGRIRQRVFDRDENTCLAAGRACVGGLTIQHAIGRGMGGSAMFDAPSLLRTLCSGHNGLIESSHLFRGLALTNGWSIPRMSLLDPLTVPVRYPGGRWFTLDDAFGRTEVWPAP